jgi:hypothetical protein
MGRYSLGIRETERLVGVNLPTARLTGMAAVCVTAPVAVIRRVVVRRSPADKPAGSACRVRVKGIVPVMALIVSQEASSWAVQTRSPPWLTTLRKRGLVSAGPLGPQVDL